MLSQLHARPELITEVISFVHRLTGAVEQFKAVVRLTDGSNLHINEVWVVGKLQKYAYYQVTPTGDVVQGWDNAPHHPEISTHPHHHHGAVGVEPSTVGGLADILDILANQL